MKTNIEKIQKIAAQLKELPEDGKGIVIGYLLRIEEEKSKKEEERTA